MPRRRTAIATGNTIADAVERTALISAREKRGLTRRHLSEALGIPFTTIFRIETGTRHPSLALMQRWAAALGGAPMELFRAEAPRGKLREAGRPQQRGA